MDRSVLKGAVLACLSACVGVSPIRGAEPAPSPVEAPNIVFLISEDPSNYKATKTIPAFADMLGDRYGCRCTVLRREGDLNAARFPGLEVIQKADLMVIFFRRCALPESQLAMIRAYLAAGKPLVGVRTANHALAPRGEIAQEHSKWDTFCSEVLGCGNHGYGPNALGTDVCVVPDAADHPILAGVKPSQWHSRGSLYLVKPVDKAATVLLTGSVDDKVEPVAWTRLCGKSRIFYTTLGYQDDFQLPRFRNLLVNSLFWAMDRPFAASDAVQDGWIEISDDLSEFQKPTGNWYVAGDACMDAKDEKRLIGQPGQGVLINGRDGITDNLLTQKQWGDVEVCLEFTLPRGSNSGVKLHGLYEIQIADDDQAAKLTGNDCGGIYPRAELELNPLKYYHIDEGTAPLANAAKAPGQWQTLTIVFRAPRFDPSGRKTSNARFEKVVLNGKLIHDDVELVHPTGHAWHEPEHAVGPLLLQADHGPVAFRHVRLRPLEPKHSAADAVTREWKNSLKPRGKSGPTLKLAANGATNYVIVIPEKPTTQEQKASQDLAQWLREMTGVAFPIVSDTSAPIPTEICIGRTNRLAQAKLPQTDSDLGDEGYAIAVQDKRLFLTGGRKRGPIYAVYALLEEDLGCRWYGGTEARIPKHPTLQFSPVSRRFAPTLRIREPYYADAFDATWSLHNRTNAPSAAVPEQWGGHMDYDGMFVHTYAALVPPAKYFEDHPEYFSMIDGKRNPLQLCETNPDVIRIVTEKIMQKLEENPHTEILGVSANDGGGHCTCPTCQKLIEENGSPAATSIHLVNRIGEAVEKEHPDVFIQALAYLDTVNPPTSIRPRRNVTVQLCNNLHSWSFPLTCFADDNQARSKRYRDAIVGWAKICDQLYIWDYFVNFSHYLAPMPNMHVLKPSVDFYLAHNVKGIMFQGAFQGPGERSLMRSWVMAKLLWDPSLDVAALTEDFARGYFEDAAEPILEYYTLLERARVENMNTMAVPTNGIRFGMDSAFLSRDLLDKATALFDRAESLAGSDEIRRRVQRERLPITYVKLRQGPAIWGATYAKLIDDFETVARRERIVCLREGAPDLDKELKAWWTALAKQSHATDVTEKQTSPD